MCAYPLYACIHSELKGIHFVIKFCVCIAYIYIVKFIDKNPEYVVVTDIKCLILHNFNSWNIWSFTQYMGNNS